MVSKQNLNAKGVRASVGGMLAEFAQGAEHQEMGCVPMPVFPAQRGKYKNQKLRVIWLDCHHMNTA